MHERLGIIYRDVLCVAGRAFPNALSAFLIVSLALVARDFTWLRGILYSLIFMLGKAILYLYNSFNHCETNRNTCRLVD